MYSIPAYDCNDPWVVGTIDALVTDASENFSFVWNINRVTKLDGPLEKDPFMR